MQYIMYDKMLRIVSIFNFNKFKPKLEANESISYSNTSDDIRTYYNIMAYGRCNSNNIRFVSEIEPLPKAITDSCSGIIQRNDIIQYAINPKRKGRLYDVSNIEGYINLLKDHPKFIISNSIDMANLVSTHSRVVQSEEKLVYNNILEEMLIQKIDITDSINSFFSNLLNTENFSLLLPTLAALDPIELSDLVKTYANSYSSKIRKTRSGHNG